MKRIFACTLMIVILCLSTACGNSMPTVDDAVDTIYADGWYSTEYSAEQITSIEEQFPLEGSITRIVHMVDQGTSIVPFDWAYIFEFSNEADAILVEENRSAYVSTLKNGLCVRFGTLLVFGTTERIADVGK